MSAPTREWQAHAEAEALGRRAGFGGGGEGRESSDERVTDAFSGWGKRLARG